MGRALRWRRSNLKLARYHDSRISVGEIKLQAIKLSDKKSFVGNKKNNDIIIHSIQHQIKSAPESGNEAYHSTGSGVFILLAFQGSFMRRTRCFPYNGTALRHPHDSGRRPPAPDSLRSS